MKLQILRQYKSTMKTPFDFIIYKLKDDKCILEDPNENRVTIDTVYKLNKYFDISNISTPWRPLFDYDKFISIQHNQTKYFFPLFDEDIRYFNLSFNHRIEQWQIPDDFFNKLSKMEEIVFDNFKINLIRKDPDEYYITARLPLYKTYCIKNTSFGINNIYNSYYLAMRHNQQFYRFPYGNVSITDDKLCLGGDIRVHHDIILASDIQQNLPEKLLFFLTTTFFSNDYGMQLRASQYKKIHFDIDKIKELIRNELYDEISTVDALFYLSQVPINELEYNPFLLSSNNDFNEINNIMVEGENNEYRKNQ